MRIWSQDSQLCPISCVLELDELFECQLWCSLRVQSCICLPKALVRSQCVHGHVRASVVAQWLPKPANRMNRGVPLGFWPSLVQLTQPSQGRQLINSPQICTDPYNHIVDMWSEIIIYHSRLLPKMWVLLFIQSPFAPRRLCSCLLRFLESEKPVLDPSSVSDFGGPHTN